MKLSVAHLIAYDYPLPEIISVAEQFTLWIYYASYYEVTNFISKKHIYEISLCKHNKYVEELRRYLIENIEIETEVELWSIYLGGDHTKQSVTKIPLKNIGAHEIDDALDAIHWYEENYYTPKRKSTTVSELNVNDISFVLDNYGVCLAVKR